MPGARDFIDDLAEAEDLLTWLRSKDDRSTSKRAEPMGSLDRADVARQKARAHLGLIPQAISAWKEQQPWQDPEREEVVRSACLGLWLAAKHFEPDRAAIKGYAFGDYAKWWIRRYVEKGLEAA